MVSDEIPGSPECERCGAYQYLWRRYRGLTECQTCTERRLDILCRGTGAQMLSYVLAEATPERCKELLTRLEEAYAEDSETLGLIRELVNRRQGDFPDLGALDAAVARLRRRGEVLEERAYRRPRTGAFRLKGLWGGRRWRTR